LEHFVVLTGEDEVRAGQLAQVQRKQETLRAFGTAVTQAVAGSFVLRLKGLSRAFLRRAVAVVEARRQVSLTRPVRSALLVCLTFNSSAIFFFAVVELGGTDPSQVTVPMARRELTDTAAGAVVLRLMTLETAEQEEWEGTGTA
jgi:hypothetical protein